jgi:hypothetical protein
MKTLKFIFTGGRTAELFTENIEPQNVTVWFHFAQTFI